LRFHESARNPSPIVQSSENISFASGVNPNEKPGIEDFVVFENLLRKAMKHYDINLKWSIFSHIAGWADEDRGEQKSERHQLPFKKYSETVDRKW
jgi:hypothetical protein